MLPAAACHSVGITPLHAPLASPRSTPASRQSHLFWSQTPGVFGRGFPGWHWVPRLAEGPQDGIGFPRVAQGPRMAQGPPGSTAPPSLPATSALPTQASGFWACPQGVPTAPASSDTPARAGCHSHSQCLPHAVACFDTRRVPGPWHRTPPGLFLFLPAQPGMGTGMGTAGARPSLSCLPEMPLPTRDASL